MIMQMSGLVFLMEAIKFPKSDSICANESHLPMLLEPTCTMIVSCPSNRICLLLKNTDRLAIIVALGCADNVTLRSEEFL